MSSALIVGVSGLTLNTEEIDFIAGTKPWALVLFARNIENREQVRAIILHFRKLVGDKAAPVLIDQEGGRVQRLRPPVAPNYPSAEAIGDVYRNSTAKGERAAWLTARLIGDDLHDLGINVDCDPVADLRVPGAHDVIGNRAYGDTVNAVVALARAKIKGLLDAGVLPIIKHIPGHGRAGADSHHNLPIVDTKHAQLSKTDFAPFKALNDAPFAMTAHVVYSDIDANAPATTSKKMISDIIRTEIGFDGALMSDDLGMKALSGTFAEKAHASLEAGCDLILHCSGDINEMRDTATRVPELKGEALRRCSAAVAQCKAPQPFDRAAAEVELQSLLREAGAPAFESLVA